MEYIDIIEELNESLFNEFGEVDQAFNYSTDGYIDIIKFGEILLWHSELDDREWIEEKNDYEPLLPHIKKLFNEEVDRLYKLKF